MLLPFLARIPSRTISSPTFTDSCVKPARFMALGEPSSHSHFSTVPLAFLTSMKSQAWGFRQSSLVSVPVSVMGFFWSNSAAREWWAQREVPPDMPRQKVRMIRRFWILFAPVDLFILQHVWRRFGKLSGRLCSEAPLLALPDHPI